MLLMCCKYRVTVIVKNQQYSDGLSMEHQCLEPDTIHAL